MFSKKEKKKTLKTLAIVGNSPNELSENINNTMSRLIEAGYEIESIAGYNIAYIHSGPYQEYVQYSSLIIYWEQNNE